MDDKLVFTATQIEAYAQCPRLFWNRVLEKREEDSNMTALNMGSLFHTATQSKAIALDIIRRAKKPLKIRDELVLKNMINQIPEKMKGAEYVDEMRLESKRECFTVYGRADRIFLHEGKYKIVDYKTSATDMKEEEVWESMHQWYIYPVLLADEIGLGDEETISFSYIIYKKSSGKIMPEDIGKEGQVKDFKKIFHELEKKITMSLLSEQYEPNPKPEYRCQYCPSRKLCKDDGIL